MRKSISLIKFTSRNEKFLSLSLFYHCLNFWMTKIVIVTTRINLFIILLIYENNVDNVLICFMQWITQNLMLFLKYLYWLIKLFLWTRKRRVDVFKLNLINYFWKFLNNLHVIWNLIKKFMHLFMSLSIRKKMKISKNQIKCRIN